MLDSVRKLKVQLNKTVDQRVSELNYPTPVEVGMKIPGTDPHILVREDGVAEIAANPTTGIRADSANSSVTLQGASLNLSAQDIHLHAGAGGMWFGFQRFDPLGWWKPHVPVTSVTTAWNGPLVLNNPASVAALSTPLVAGPPDLERGQFNITLASIMHPQPLLGPDEMFLIIAKNVAHLLTALKA